MCRLLYVLLTVLITIGSTAAVDDLQSREKIANASLENSLVALRAYLASNETNPSYDALNVLASHACIVSKTEDLFELFRYNVSFSNPQEAEKTFNKTDLSKLYYQQKNLYLLSDKVNASEKFCDFLRNYRYADIKENVHFGNLSKIDIKDYLKNETKHKVDDKFTQFLKLNGSDQLVFLTSSRLNETFAEKFDKNQTKNGTFWNNGRDKIETLFMHRKGEYKHTSNEELSALAIKYVSGNRLVLISPKKRDGLKELLQNLTLDKLREILQSMTTKVVSVKIPMFETMSAKNIQAMDTENLYAQLLSSNPEVSDVAEKGKVVLTNIHTITSFRIDESGSRVSVVAKKSDRKEIRPGGSGKVEEAKFICKHPFAWMVVSPNANIVIYTGFVNKL